MPQWIKKDAARIDPLFSTKLLIERNEKVCVRNSLAFIDYVKAFDKVKRHEFLDRLQGKNTPNLVLKIVIQIYSGNKLKVKINNKLSKWNTIDRRVRKGCPLSPTVFNMKATGRK